MLMGVDGEITDEMTVSLQSIETSAENLLRLINDILDIAKIEAGRLEIIEAPTDFNALVSSWVTQIKVQCDQKKISFRQEIPSNFPAMIHVDGERLTQIVMNLLSNAVKFTSEGGVTLYVRQLEDKWQLSIEDTGIGIPPNALEYIFDEFRQVDGTYKRAYGGTGLGLAIVRKLAEAMDGSVTVDSYLGIGSTFTVKLPLKISVETVEIATKGLQKL
jgi:signal transduction histidine kinase